MASRFPLSRTALQAVVLAALSSDAAAQDAADSTRLDTVTVTGRSPTSSAAVGGFGDVPLARSPLQATVVTLDQLREGGGIGLAALTRYDASISDSYNAEGYWSNFVVRGFSLDNQFSYRRDGLPIDAETSIGLDNKASVEILKGTSGIQAGTSAPGGLVNLVVKRPDVNLRSATLGWRENGTVLGAVDLSQRFGPQQAFGVRLNVAAERLDPQTRDLEGHRQLAALAVDWKPGADTLLEAEIETSHQSQRSVPGFSLLGPRLPDANSIDPRINLNNQPWSLPVILDGTTGSLRWTQRLSADWKFVAHAGVQRLLSDDRLAFSYGCSKEGNFDRYCSDGTFDFYEFRSDDEHRDTDALDLHAEGKLTTGPLLHSLTVGALASRFKSRLQPRLDDGTIVGSGSIDGLTIIPTLPNLGLLPNTNLTQRSTELYLRDRIEFAADWSLWAGLRHTRLHRESVQTDGTEATAYDQSFTTPWLALSYAVSPGLMAYASWGEGVESAVAPNRDVYVNAGQALPAQRSRQYEFGLKRADRELDWSLTWFDIDKPLFGDVALPDGSLSFQTDGKERHRGIEAQAEWKAGSYAVQGSAMWLDAKRRGAADPTLDGKRPTNVPNRALKLTGSYFIAAVPGLNLQAGMVYEGPRMVLPDNSVSIPGWTRFDLAARYQQKVSATTLTWLLGVDNAADRRAWKEAPYQYAHAYLYPLSPRTWRVALQADF